MSNPISPWRWLIALVLVSLASLGQGCDARTSEERVREKARQEVLQYNELNRDLQHSRTADIAAVERYRSWFQRLHHLDHSALGLPEPEPLSDGAIHPATTSATFCQRVASAPGSEAPPNPEQWKTAYLEYVARFVVLLEPETYEEYRAHYIAERHLARLACIAGEGAPALRQALLDLLTASDAELGDWISNAADISQTHHEPWPEGDTDNRAMFRDAVRYTAAIYAFNHGLAAEQIPRILDSLSKSGSLFAVELSDRLERGSRPVSLGFNLASDYQLRRASLRNDLNGQRIRHGQVRSPQP